MANSLNDYADNMNPEEDTIPYLLKLSPAVFMTRINTFLSIVQA